MIRMNRNLLCYLFPGMYVLNKRIFMVTHVNIVYRLRRRAEILNASQYAASPKQTDEQRQRLAIFNT